VSASLLTLVVHDRPPQPEVPSETKILSLADERSRLEACLASPGRTRKETATLTLETFTFASRAAEVFAKGTRVQQRIILVATGLNPILESRKLRIQAKNPFRFITGMGARPDWSGCRDLNPGPPGPKPGALPTAPHPASSTADMILALQERLGQTGVWPGYARPLA
jgi:hypothetical protein